VTGKNDIAEKHDAPLEEVFKQRVGQERLVAHAKRSIPCDSSVSQTNTWREFVLQNLVQDTSCTIIICHNNSQ